jgi:hypothetical protein
MDEILEHVLPQYKEWVTQLKPEGIAHLLNSVACVPHMTVIKKPKADHAANIGKNGEQQFENIVSQYMNNSYTLINNAKKAHSGDFVLSWQSPKTNSIYKILIDVKNYKSSSVSTKEVEKLYRDLNVNSVNGGFMISLGSKITGFSKIIEIKKFFLENGQQIPIVFANIHTPEVICEVLKMLFHVIETRDISCKNIQSHNLDGLFYQINQLNDNIQLITETREVLQDSKNKIDTSLNNIMYKLMSCEYSLINKIAVINATMINHQDELKLIEPEPNEILSMVDNIQQTFNIPIDIVPLLHSIFKVGWDSSFIDIPKRKWVLIKNDAHITIKIFKAATGIIFPLVSESMTEIIENLKKIDKKIIRNTSVGVDIKINNNTIGNIVKLCTLIN